MRFVNIIQRFLSIEKEKNFILIVQLLKNLYQKILIICVIFYYDNRAVFIYDKMFLSIFHWRLVKSRNSLSDLLILGDIKYEEGERQKTDRVD